MTRYRKKPVEVEAWQVGTEPAPDWVEKVSQPYRCTDAELHDVKIVGRKLIVVCLGDDFIVKHEDGKITRERPDRFLQIYEVVE